MRGSMGGNDDKRKCVCDNVLDVPAGQWIPACAGMTRVCAGADVRV